MALLIACPVAYLLLVISFTRFAVPADDDAFAASILALAVVFGCAVVLNIVRLGIWALARRRQQAARPHAE